MIDQGEASKTQEVVAQKRPRLLFHVSGIGETALEPMKKFGLVANRATLTPRLDIGTYYSAGDCLTFWYPERGEVDHGREARVETPTTELPEHMRGQMLDYISKMDIDDFFKNPQKRFVEQAKTYLPGERLRAVAKGRVFYLESIFPQESSRFISWYMKEGKEMTKEVREALDDMNIVFLDPTLNKAILADDIVRTYVEHNLSEVGDYKRDSKRSLEKKLKTLEEASFEDPVYERYRKMIISGIQRKLASLPTASSEEK